MGADARGQQELVGRWDGYRQSEQAWTELLLDLQSRGLAQAPPWAIGDGAVGFWQALRPGYGQTRWQRCWVQKTATVLAKRPKDLQAQATQRRQAIGLAPDRQRAELAFDLFSAAYEAKYPKATECVAPDRAVFVAFDDFPAEHGGHIRTTHPRASTFATVRLRTAKTRGWLSRVTMLAMVFKL
jgi:transposase-like protein